MGKVRQTTEQEWRTQVKAFINYRINMTGKTNKSVAKEMRMKPCTLSSKKKYPERISFGEARALARILGCRPEDLIRGGSLELSD